MLNRIKAYLLTAVVIVLIFGIPAVSIAQSKSNKPSMEEPLIVNGDKVEYLTGENKITATGNVSILFKKSKLTCSKITVNTTTQDAVAQGNVRIDDDRGIMFGEKVLYNFKDRTGTVVNGRFLSSPYFGKAQEVKRANEKEFRGLRGYVSTCDYDQPHYQIKSKNILLVPEDKLQTKSDVFFIGKVPFMYLPYYNHSLQDPMMHVQLTPGYKKRWGPFLLSAWRYNLTEDITGRIYLDYRQKKGFAEGFGYNFKTDEFGNGDTKFYFTQERTRDLEEEERAEFRRWFGRWRYKWGIDEYTDVTAEYNKIYDSKRSVRGSDYNILKDYFPREYDKDTTPISYGRLHRNFTYASADVLFEGRSYDWYPAGYVEKLPEVTYSLPAYELGESPFYFDSKSTIANLNQKNTNSLNWAPNVHVNRLDTTNKLSMPFKLSFLNINPFAGSQETFYDKDKEADLRARTIFLTGTDLSTKFYRLFDYNTDFLGLDINGIRHIVTPSVSYAYDHEPTISANYLRQLDAIDTITYSNNRASLELLNTFQTKRNKKKVDLAILKLNSTYYFKPKNGPGSYMGDYLYDFELIPYSWLTFNSDGVYSHRYSYFTSVNYDVGLNLGKGWSINIGERYERTANREYTLDTTWLLTPKWRFEIFERYQSRKTAGVKNGLRYQEYALTRDLHCWDISFRHIIEKSVETSTWAVLTLKAFPETEVEYGHTYHVPKPGSQKP
jgi:LPS-assembly protein